ncbi:MAG: hypothetical protein ACKO43_00330 [Alphaproteobacteria bacterium]
MMAKYLTEATPRDSRKTGRVSQGRDSIRDWIQQEVQGLFENQVKSLLRQEVREQVRDQIVSSLSSLRPTAGATQSLMDPQGDGGDAGFALSQSQISALILQGLRSGG